jgi:DNA-directed RNA polymerase subunit RPC12/RpoP
MANYLNGTCARCKNRFRFDTKMVLKNTLIHCPHCNLSLDTDYLKMMDRLLEGENKKS